MTEALRGPVLAVLNILARGALLRGLAGEKLGERYAEPGHGLVDLPYVRWVFVCSLQ